MDELVDNESNSLFAFDAIGIHWKIETYEPLSDIVKKKVLDRIESFDRSLEVSYRNAASGKSRTCCWYS